MAGVGLHCWPSKLAQKNLAPGCDSQQGFWQCGEWSEQRCRLKSRFENHVGKTIINHKLHKPSSSHHHVYRWYFIHVFFPFPVIGWQKWHSFSHKKLQLPKVVKITRLSGRWYSEGSEHWIHWSAKQRGHGIHGCPRKESWRMNFPHQKNILHWLLACDSLCWIKNYTLHTHTHYIHHINNHITVQYMTLQNIPVVQHQALTEASNIGIKDGRATPLHRQMVGLSGCPSSYLSMSLFIQSMHPCIHASMHPSISLSAYLPICLSAYLPICLSAYLPIYLSICLSISSHLISSHLI